MAETRVKRHGRLDWLLHICLAGAHPIVRPRNLWGPNRGLRTSVYVQIKLQPTSLDCLGCFSPYIVGRGQQSALSSPGSCDTGPSQWLTGDWQSGPPFWILLIMSLYRNAIWFLNGIHQYTRSVHTFSFYKNIDLKKLQSADSCWFSFFVCGYKLLCLITGSVCLHP